MTKITIDWTVWATATTLAAELTEQGKPTSPQSVNNWRRRGLIDYKKFEGLDKPLYKRGSIRVKGYEGC